MVEMNSNEASRQTSGLAKGSEAYKSKVLPEDFVLSDYDVICGRGSRCFNHIGNLRFRELVQQHLDRYSSITASSKIKKNVILCEVVNIVRSRSPNGGFVKKEKTNGRYVEVGDFLAREKTSQAFRDALHDRYKSSNTRKRINRIQKKISSSNQSSDVESQSKQDSCARQHRTMSLTSPDSTDSEDNNNDGSIHREPITRTLKTQKFESSDQENCKVTEREIRVGAIKSNTPIWYEYNIPDKGLARLNQPLEKYQMSKQQRVTSIADPTTISHGTNDRLPPLDRWETCFESLVLDEAGCKRLSGLAFASLSSLDPPTRNIFQASCNDDQQKNSGSIIPTSMCRGRRTRTPTLNSPSHDTGSACLPGSPSCNNGSLKSSRYQSLRNECTIQSSIGDGGGVWTNSHRYNVENENTSNSAVVFDVLLRNLAPSSESCEGDMNFDPVPIMEPI